MRKIMVIIFLLSAAFYGFASDIDTANPNFELNRIMGTLNTTPYLSFTANYYTEKVDSSGLKRDSVIGWCKLNGKKFSAKRDSSTLIQNSFYCLTINKRDSFMLVSRTQDTYTSIFGINLLDASLQRNYISGVTLSDSSTQRKMTYSLKSFAPYTLVEICYDTTTYLPKYVTYKMKMYGQGVVLPGFYLQVTAKFSGFATNSFTDAVFDTSPYINRLNGVYTAVVPFNNYRFYDQTLNP